MTPSRIFVFIISVFAMILLLSFTVPEEGLRLFGFTVNFPGTEEIADQIMARSPSEPAPEEILALREAALARAKQDSFEHFVNDDPSRLHFPNSDVSLFDPFFKALCEASVRPVRIMHYGDSQLEEDRITGTLRDSLQKHFGGIGPGLLPLDKYYTHSISEVSSTVPEKYSVFGYLGEKRKDGLYGPLGLMSVLDSSMFVNISTAKSYNGTAGKFSRLGLLFGRTHGNVTVKCGASSRQLPADSQTRTVRWESFELPDSSSRVSFSVSSGAEVYGIMLDGRTGVSVDNIAMRGCDGDVFTRIEKSHLSDYIEKADVALIILQFGGNAVPAINGSASISAYCNTVRRQIRHFRTIAPHSCILFIGPTDMSTGIRGKMQTYPCLPEMVDSLRSAANDSGAAYWDMYSVMGGSGSMDRWVKSSPALAGSDHVHFTRKGSEKMGGLLYGTIKLYYDYYMFRRGQ